jgi:hypothetical protein
MSSQENATIMQEEKKSVNVLGVNVPKWLLKLLIVAIAAYALFYLYKSYSLKVISLPVSVVPNVSTVDTATMPEIKAIRG